MTSVVQDGTERRRAADGAPADAVAPPADRRSASGPDVFRDSAVVGGRLLILAAVSVVVLYVAARLYLVTVSVAVALLVTALLWPLDQGARRLGLPRPAAALVAFLVGIAVVAGMTWFVYVQLAVGLDAVTTSVVQGTDRAVQWLETGPLSLDEVRLGSLGTELGDYLQRNGSSLTSGALAVVATAGRVLAGLALVLFLTFFFLYDGERIWRWVTRLFPASSRERVDEAGRASWETLAGFMRGTVLVALFDAVLIGLGLVVLQVPLAAPLAVLVFLGAFVPVVGATVTGALAVLVALASNGPTTAVLVLALILVVQQVEGNLLQPLLLGKMVRIHPVAVVLAVTAGSTVAGLPGAVFGVPLAAVVNTAASRLVRRT